MRDEIFHVICFGLIWNKQDLLLETCRINFLAEHAVKEIQAEMDKVNQRP
jgi:hypothetical protein